jgi:hypothetical protein
MTTLSELFPTAEALLEVSPEDLAPVLLRLGAAQRQNGMFTREAVAVVGITGMAHEKHFAYAMHKKPQIDALINEAWKVLDRDGLILRAPGMNGVNGWMVLSRDGEKR